MEKQDHFTGVGLDDYISGTVTSPAFRVHHNIALSPNHIQFDTQPLNPKHIQLDTHSTAGLPACTYTNIASPPHAPQDRINSKE